MLGLLPLQNCSGHGSLSIAKSSITGTDLTMLKDLEARFCASGAKQAGKTAALPPVATHCDQRDAALLAGLGWGKNEALSDHGLKLRGNAGLDGNHQGMRATTERAMLCGIGPCRRPQGRACVSSRDSFSRRDAADDSAKSRSQDHDGEGLAMTVFAARKAVSPPIS